MADVRPDRLRLVDPVARVLPTGRVRQGSDQVDFATTSPGARRTSTSSEPTWSLDADLGGGGPRD
jgi:hypothetical protein